MVNSESPEINKLVLVIKEDVNRGMVVEIDEWYDVLVEEATTAVVGVNPAVNSD